MHRPAIHRLYSTYTLDSTTLQPQPGCTSHRRRDGSGMLPLHASHACPSDSLTQRNAPLPNAVNIFNCAICDKGYPRQTDYENHLRSYDHNHRQRLAEMKKLTDANANASDAPRQSKGPLDMRAIPQADQSQVPLGPRFRKVGPATTGGSRFKKVGVQVRDTKPEEASKPASKQGGHVGTKEGDANVATAQEGATNSKNAQEGANTKNAQEAANVELHDDAHVETISNLHKDEDVVMGDSYDDSDGNGDGHNSYSDSHGYGNGNGNGDEDVDEDVDRAKDAYEFKDGYGNDDEDEDEDEIEDDDVISWEEYDPTKPSDCDHATCPGCILASQARSAAQGPA